MKTPKPFKLPNRISWVKVKLRRVSLQWPARTQALRNARIERGLYKCAMCEERFPVKKVQLDHVEPVIAVTDGFTNWDDYINRLLPDVDGFQVLCENCHDIKTQLEDSRRAFHKKKKKK